MTTWLDLTWQVPGRKKTGGREGRSRSLKRMGIYSLRHLQQRRAKFALIADAPPILAGPGGLHSHRLGRRSDDVQLHCMIKKGFSWRGKMSFPIQRLSTQYEWNIEKELPMSLSLSVLCCVCVVFPTLFCPYLVCFMSSTSVIISYVPAVFYYVHDYTVYLSSCLLR